MGGVLNGILYTAAMFRGITGRAYAAIWDKFLADMAADFGFAKGVGALSTTSLSIGAGSKTFALQPATANLPVDTTIEAFNPFDPGQWMIGTVAQLAGGAATLNVAFYNGSGTVATWVLRPPASIRTMPRLTTLTGPATLAHGMMIAADTSGGAFTLTLPAAPATHDAVLLADVFQSWATYNLTIAGNGKDIAGGGLTGANLVCNRRGSRFMLVYGGANWGYLHA